MSLTLSIFIGISLLIVAVAVAIHIITKRIETIVEVTTRRIEATIKTAADVPVKITETIADFGKHAIDRATDAFTAIFQAKIKIVSSTTVCDATPIVELAVLRRNIHEIIDYSETSLGSTKRIVAEQNFVAKIGFDLADRFSASLDSSNRVMTIDLPEPKMLSLEAASPAPTYYLDASGLINWLKTKDHQEILTKLDEQARKSVALTLAIGDAKQMIQTRFQDLFRDFDVKVIVLFSSDSPKIAG